MAQGSSKMSSVISIFVHRSAALSTVVELLSRIIGSTDSVESVDGETRHTWRALGMEFIAFGDHGLENDRGIAFNEYGVEIDVVLGATTWFRELEAMREGCCTYVGRRLAGELRTATLVVRDLQQELGRYGSLGSSDQ